MSACDTGKNTGGISATAGRPSDFAWRPSSIAARGRMSVMLAKTGSGAASSATIVEHLLALVDA